MFAIQLFTVVHAARVLYRSAWGRLAAAVVLLVGSYAASGMLGAATHAEPTRHSQGLAPTIVVPRDQPATAKPLVVKPAKPVVVAPAEKVMSL